MSLAFSAGDAAYWGLAIFLVLLGVGSVFALVKLGRMFDKVSSLVSGTERDALAVVVKTGGTVDRVNYQLDKLDTVTDSAVSVADSADTAVRAVSTAISKPVEKVSGFTAGVAHGFAAFRRKRSFSDAMDTAKDAARRREEDLPRTSGALARRRRRAWPDRRRHHRRPRNPLRGRSRHHSEADSGAHPAGRASTGRLAHRGDRRGRRRRRPPSGAQPGRSTVCRSSRDLGVRAGELVADWLRAKGLG